MPTEAEWIATIAADPDNDGLRLICADWYEQQGDELRGEFIRLQVELAAFGEKCGRTGKVPWCSAPECRGCSLRIREQEVFTAAGGQQVEWLGEPLHDLTIAGQDWIDYLPWFNRGFVSAVRLSWEDWAADADAILRAAPVVEVRLTTRPTDDDVELDRPLNSQPPWPKMRWRIGKTWMDVTVGWPSGGGMRGGWVEQLLSVEWPCIRKWVLSEPRITNATGTNTALLFGRLPGASHTAAADDAELDERMTLT